MMLKPWWKLDEKGKARRSFQLAFICLLIVFIPDAWFEPSFMKYIVAIVGSLGMILRGLFYLKSANG